MPELFTDADVPGAPVVVVPTAIVAAGPNLTHEAGAVQVNAAVERELTIVIEAQTVLTGDTGGVDDHPVGAVPTLVTKFQDPPVGVAGAVADSLKINHSK